MHAHLTVYNGMEWFSDLWFLVFCCCFFFFFFFGIIDIPPWPLDNSYLVNGPRSPESWLPASLGVLTDFEEGDIGVGTK